MDIRYAFRTLARNPGFTFAAVSALALGIGANTAVFSVVNGVLLRPLPYAGSDRLVMIFDNFTPQNLARGPACVADYLDWKARSTSFENMAVFTNNRFTLTGDGDAEQIPGMGVSASLFSILGVMPAVGRNFASDEDQPGRTPVVLLSHSLWQRRYSGDRAVVGKTVLLNGRPFTVIGIMPAGFRFHAPDAEVWTSFTINPPTRRGPFFLYGVARLMPGVSVEQAAAEMNTIAAAVEKADPKSYHNLKFPVLPMKEVYASDVRRLLLVLQGAVLLVLLIAIANVANLLLGRAAGRQREMAIRLSMGAEPRHIFRQLLVESSILALAGGAAGVLLAWTAVTALRNLRPAGVPRIEEIAIDGSVLLCTLLLSLVAGIVFGMAPALSAARSSLSESLKQGSRSGTDAKGHRQLRGILVAAEVGFSVVLLIGAGLLIRSFHELGHVRTGFSAPPERILAMSLSPTGQRYSDQQQLGAYWERLLEKLRAVPGVESVSVALTMPPNRIAYGDGFEIEGRTPQENAENPSVPVPHVSPDYFATLGIRVLVGRVFDARDNASVPRVAVISESLAKRYFNGENPVGRRIKHGGPALRNPYMEIIGVVADVKYSGLDGRDQPVYYEAAAQIPSRPMWVVLRTTGPAAAMSNAIRREIQSIDRDVPIARLDTMDNVLSASMQTPRFRTTLMGIFAAAALLLASIGIYGVVSYSVSQRTKEIGIRMALGANASKVERMVVGQGFVMAAIGIGCGLASALALSQLLETLLFGVTARDPITFAAVPLILASVAAFASYVPARRASRVDPLQALRQE